MDEDAAKSGRERRPHPDFVVYMKEMVDNPVYAGMPDAITPEGNIQWAAATNRSPGWAQFTHDKRMAWWKQKANQLGIDITSDQWISKVAKTIHPTKHKPCYCCGRIMDIRYAYPAKILLKRLEKLDYLDDTFPLDPLEHTLDLVTRAHGAYSQRFLDDLPRLLKSKVIASTLQPGSGLLAWVTWIDQVYIPAEPRGILSPGAMSNAPDRFDGFHSYNNCCRGNADTGRHAENMRTYTTDRRVAEYWAGGNWVAADRLMGLVNKSFRAAPCLNGHAGPCDADHIGPLSLGFTHRAEFQLLCSSCNSAKNNRMMLSDVIHLRQIEANTDTDPVVSWHSKAVWDRRKNDVVDRETAERLSKLLRDNRHSVMAILKQVAAAGHYAFLASLLELHWAEFDYEFEDLRVEDHRTIFRSLIVSHRSSAYVAEQKSYHLRVAFVALRNYFAKDNRNEYVISTPVSEQAVIDALTSLARASDKIKDLDLRLDEALSGGDTHLDSALRNIAPQVPPFGAAVTSFTEAKGHLVVALESIADELSGRWEHTRYVRLWDPDA